MVAAGKRCERQMRDSTRLGQYEDWSAPDNLVAAIEFITGRTVALGKSEALASPETLVQRS